MVNCSLCGKGMFIPYIHLRIVDEENASSSILKLCKECYVKTIHEAEERAKKRDCSFCAYFEHKYEGGMVVSEGVVRGGFIGGVCRKLDNLRLSAFRLIPSGGGPQRVYFRLAERCVHYEDKRDFLKKAVKGEIATEKEAYYVICKYCGARYDVNKYFKCPNCGAINR